MIARLHNNKANKVTSAFKADCRPTPACSRLSSTHRTRALRIPHFNRRRRATILKLSKYYSAPHSGPMSDNVTTTTMPSTPVKQTVRVTLPATLPTPLRVDIDREALRKACPELKDTPPQYVRNVVRKMYSHMYAGILSSTVMPSSTSALPDELQVLLSDPISINGVCPTHVLAITSSLGVQAGVPRKFTLFPTHQLVLAANCAALPAFPSSPTAIPFKSNSDSVSMPVVRLSLPYPETFGTLMWFLYKKDTEGLRQMLLPRNWSADMSSALKAARVVYGVWANACALRVVEPEVYDVLEDTWQEITRRLTETKTAPSS